MPLTRVQLILAVVSTGLLVAVVGWWIQLSRVAVGPASGGDAIPIVVLAADAIAMPAPTVSDSPTPLLPSGIVDTGWLAQAAITTRIPVRALQAYAGAAIVATSRHPGCHLGWNTLAAIGELESAHGTIHGGRIQPDGSTSIRILGPTLTATDGTRMADTDGGALDGDPTADHAVGPMQITPATWGRYGVDANGDGVADPNQIDDAVLTATDYLCAAGGDLSVAANWTTAIRAYNPDDAYVSAVEAAADRYARPVAS